MRSIEQNRRYSKQINAVEIPQSAVDILFVSMSFVRGHFIHSIFVNTKNPFTIVCESVTFNSYSR